MEKHQPDDEKDRKDLFEFNKLIPLLLPSLSFIILLVRYNHREEKTKSDTLNFESKIVGNAMGQCPP